MELMDLHRQDLLRQLRYWRAKAGYLIMPEDFYRNYEDHELARQVFLAKRGAQQAVAGDRFDVV